MRRIKILGIAPYEGLKNLMDQAAESRDSIELHTIIADQSDAMEYISDLDDTLFDAIISRGGTATSVREMVSIPVFDILLSYYDIFNILKLAENLHERFCIVCYPSLAEKADNICRLLDYDVKTYVTRSWAESQAQVDRAISDGYAMILGDVTACRHAASRNIGNMLITTGMETVNEVFDRVSFFFRYFGAYEEENRILRNYVTLNQALLIVYDSTGSMIYSSAKEVSSYLKTETKKILRSVREKGAMSFIRRNNRRTYIIEASEISVKGEPCIQFQVEFKEGLLRNYSESISVMTDNQERTAFFNYLYNTVYYREIREQISFLASSAVPVLIEGPASVGKEELVRVLYANAATRNRGLFFIDCQTLSPKEFDNLINTVSSPLQENNCSFCFNHAQAMDRSMRSHLIKYLDASNFQKRNRVLFTWESAGGDPDLPDLINKVGCSVVHVPSLHRMSGVIPRLASLYINDLNTDYARQIFGISPEAETLLQGYDWPLNLDQLRRVIREAYQLTEDPYINASSVSAVLDQEKKLYVLPSETGTALDLSGTLDDITRRVIQQVLQEENGNQSKTAERLGISRTTLWRILK